MQIVPNEKNLKRNDFSFKFNQSKNQPLAFAFFEITIELRKDSEVGSPGHLLKTDPTSWYRKYDMQELNFLDSTLRLENEVLFLLILITRKLFFLENIPWKGFS